MAKYALFLGCVIPTRIPNVEIALKRVLEKVNLKTVDLPGYSCCPEPVFVRLIDKTTWLTTSARNLAIAESLGLDLLTLCIGCYETLYEANEILRKNLEERDRVNVVLRKYGKEYTGKVNVKHVVEALCEDIGTERIRKNVLKPLKIQVALHYGCHMYREKEDGDILRKPNMMKNLTSITGSRIVDYKSERLCCGYPTMQESEEFSLKSNLLTKLNHIKESGADAIVTSCPACMIQFEMGQILLKKYGISYNIPVINLVELLALSFGIPSKELSLELHRSPVLQLVQKIEAK